MRIKAVLSILALIMTSIVLFYFPEFDLKVSSLFFNEGFVLRYMESWKALREVGFFVNGIVVAVVVWLGLKWVYNREKKEFLILSLSYALSVGLVVNLVMKNFFERVRPRNIVEFGGNFKYSRVWEIGGECKHNCSFPSGEVAATFFIFLFVSIIPENLKKLYLLMAMIWYLFIVVMRIGMGGHFISDVIIGSEVVLVMYFVLQWCIESNFYRKLMSNRENIYFD